MLKWSSRNDRPWARTANAHRRGPIISEVLDELNLKRYCCRRMLLTHVDLIDKLLKYNGGVTSLQNDLELVINCDRPLETLLMQEKLARCHLCEALILAGFGLQ